MRISILFLLFFVNVLNAQPGGGGGLEIIEIYDEYRNPINRDSARIEHLVLDSLMNIVNRREITERRSIRLGVGGNKGLLIHYKGKEYRIDFENVARENGAGVVPTIGAIMLFKPYILSKRSYDHPKYGGNEFQKYFLLYNWARPYQVEGVTPETYHKLSEIGLMFDIPEAAYDRRPKPWMEDFKNLYNDYSRYNSENTEQELEEYLIRIDKIIADYGEIEVFIVLKMQFLYDRGRYQEYVELSQKVNYDVYYMQRQLVKSYHRVGEYDKAIALSLANAEKRVNQNNFHYYQHIYDYFFLKMFHKNENIREEVRAFMKKEKESGRYYSTSLFDKLELMVFYYNNRHSSLGSIQCLSEHLKRAYSCYWCSDEEYEKCKY